MTSLTYHPAQKRSRGNASLLLIVGGIVLALLIVAVVA